MNPRAIRGTRRIGTGASKPRTGGSGAWPRSMPRRTFRASSCRCRTLASSSLRTLWICRESNPGPPDFLIIVYARSSRSGARALGGDRLSPFTGPPPSRLRRRIEGSRRSVPSWFTPRPVPHGHLAGRDVLRGELDRHVGDRVVVRSQGCSLGQSGSSAARAQMMPPSAVETCQTRCRTIRQERSYFTSPVVQSVLGRPPRAGDGSGLVSASPPRAIGR